MAVEANEAPISLKTFLEGIPPYVRRELDQRFVADGYETGQPRLTVALPSVSLYGENEACKGEMTFDPVGDKTVTVTTGQNNVTSGGLSSHLVRYLCRHCRRTWKTFALELQGAAHKNGSALKIGEWPPFGPPMPRLLLGMFAADKELLLNGRRSENQGLGIGALAYYRRVIENEKTALFEAIIAVARTLPGTDNLVAELEEAKSKQGFTASAESIKAVWPTELLINGESALNLLHGALQ